MTSENPSMPPIRGSLTQRFFASDWPFLLWLIAFSLGLPLAMLRTINLRVVLAAGWHAWLPLLGTSVIFAVVGFLLGAILFSLVIVPFNHLRARLNGGPFAAGEVVVVLGGKYRGRRGTVYAQGQGNTVQVELGEEEKVLVELGQHQLLRD